MSTIKQVLAADNTNFQQLQGLVTALGGLNTQQATRITELEAGITSAQAAAQAAQAALATLPKFRSTTTANPPAPVQSELDANPNGIAGLRLTADGAQQQLKWTPHTLAGAWVTVGEPSVTAAQLGTVQTTATAAQAAAAATQTALTRTGIAQLAALPITAPPPLVDGSRWVGQVGGTPDALGTVVAAAGGDTWRREGVNGRYQAAWILNPLSTPASRTTALQQAVAALTAGETLILPTDDRAFAPLVLTPANDVTLVAGGALSINPGSGAALTIQPVSPLSTDWQVNTLKRFRLRGGLRVTTLGAPRAAGTVGLKFINLMESNEIDFGEINNFDVGAMFYGRGTSGCSYNTVALGRMVDNRITILCDQEAAAWSTQQTFRGGRLAWSDSVYPDDTWTHFRCTQAYDPGANDNNQADAVSFESYRLGGFAADLSGNYNAVLGSCRVEFHGYTSLTPLIRLRDGSVAPRMQTGFDVYGGNILNFATGTYALTRDSLYMAGGNRGRGAFTGQAVFDGDDQLFQGRNTAGAVVMEVRGDGRIRGTSVTSDTTITGVSVTANGPISGNSVSTGTAYTLPNGSQILGVSVANPNGVVSAVVGSMVLCRSGSTAKLWVKESELAAGDNTGWIQK